MLNFMSLEKFYINLAYILPKELVKWCYIRVSTYATSIESDKTPYDINVVQALELWGK